LSAPEFHRRQGEAFYVHGIVWLGGAIAVGCLKGQSFVAVREAPAAAAGPVVVGVQLYDALVWRLHHA
jgi:hypothetical protein